MNTPPSFIFNKTRFSPAQDFRPWGIALVRYWLFKAGSGPTAVTPHLPAPLSQSIQAEHSSTWPTVNHSSFLSCGGRRKLLSVVVSQNVSKRKLCFSLLLHQIKWQKLWSGPYISRAQSGYHLWLLSIGKVWCSPPRGFLHPETPLELQPAQILLVGELFW